MASSATNFIFLSFVFAFLLLTGIKSDARMMQGINFGDTLNEIKHSVTLGGTTVCIPTTSSVLVKHEGSHSCAYDHPNGYRAVGSGYNLDDDVERARSELRTTLADYDKVYSGKDCLNSVQIRALVAFDARRALNAAAKEVKALEDWCCDVQAAFADITFSSGHKELRSKEFTSITEKASAHKWDTAADELHDTRWCEDHKERCYDNEKVIRKGCENGKLGEVISLVV